MGPLKQIQILSRLSRDLLREQFKLVVSARKVYQEIRRTRSKEHDAEMKTATTSDRNERTKIAPRGRP